MLATLAGALLVPALQATVGGFYLTDLSAAGLASLALICGTRYLGGRSVRTHTLMAKLAVCGLLLAFSGYELLTLSANRPHLSQGGQAAPMLAVLLLELGIWLFTAHMTSGEQPLP